jgi:hypothetical protein
MFEYRQIVRVIHFCKLEENDKLVLTPFEKNIDIWRQLWRVLERSDLVSNAQLSLSVSPIVLVVDCLRVHMILKLSISQKK